MHYEVPPAASWRLPDTDDLRYEFPTPTGPVLTVIRAEQKLSYY